MIFQDQNAQGDLSAEEVLDVTVPLQCLVKNGKLELHSASKVKRYGLRNDCVSDYVVCFQSNLPGFFDPVLGEEKELHVVYNYHQQLHEVTIKDNESLRIPRNSKQNINHMHIICTTILCFSTSSECDLASSLWCCVSIF